MHIFGTPVISAVSRRSHACSHYQSPIAKYGTVERSDPAKCRQDDLCCRRTIRRWNPQARGFRLMYGSVGVGGKISIHPSVQSECTVHVDVPVQEACLSQAGSEFNAQMSIIRTRLISVLIPAKMQQRLAHACTPARLAQNLCRRRRRPQLPASAPAAPRSTISSTIIGTPVRSDSATSHFSISHFSFSYRRLSGQGTDSRSRFTRAAVPRLGGLYSCVHESQ